MRPKLVCPQCRTFLIQGKTHYLCPKCQIAYPIIHQIPCFALKKTKNKGFDAGAFKFLFTVENKHFWHVGRKEIIGQVLKHSLGKTDFKNIKMIEIGCGTGNVLSYLRTQNMNISGADYFIEGLQFCQQRIKAPLYQIDASQTPFANNSFDIIGLFDLIEHIQQDETLLKEAHRICKNNGKIIITVPAHQYLWSYFDQLSCHQRRYSKNELIDKLQKAGFKVEKISFYMFFLFPIFFLLRKLAGLRPNSPNQTTTALASELQPIPVINYIFLLLLRLEKYLITHLNLPWGASLICVAKKI